MAGIYGFLNKKSSKYLKETDKRVYTTENVSLTIQSSRILLSAKLILRPDIIEIVLGRKGILLKQLDYSLSTSMRR